MDLSLSKLGDSGGQGGLECYSSWGRKESDLTHQLNNNHLLRGIQGSDPDTCSNEKDKEQVPEPDINCI